MLTLPIQTTSDISGTRLIEKAITCVVYIIINVLEKRCLLLYILHNVSYKSISYIGPVLFNI